jgi:hypothetical protein
MPFSVNFVSANGNINDNWVGFIHVGTNYPNTAILGAIDLLPFRYSRYTPSTMTIFQAR